ncbi:MAG: c-type cytochrome [Verrucomicrobiaceae bacterium]|nr:c-type cytochrome [Verrucomicrobiaceae bacterium]
MRASLFLFLLAVASTQSAEPPVKPDDIAGNEAVKKIMETYAGRGTLADNTPPKSPDEAYKSFSHRKDVAIDLIAHEPEVTQPLYISFDSRGRMWVTQYRQYQFPAGLKIVSYDQHLRAKFDRVPEPPPKGPKGADIVTVHEDTNGDGLYDKTKVVLEGLNIATAAITGNGGFYVMNPPYLLFYPDANADDVPDADPVVELSGFGLEDTHSVATSLQWGPDGWLYGATGSTTTGDVSSATSKHVKWEGQHIWRFHPVKKTFQIYAEGGGNTMSLDIDSKGRVFSGTNHGGTRGMHYELGSYGVKGWGKHGPPMNPYSFEFFEHMKHEGDTKRFPQAFTIYEGGLLGSNYEGYIIAPNSLLNKVYVSEQIPDGSTFRTKDHENLMETSDRWFRPVCIAAAPDGCVYIGDWYDTRLSHVRPVDDWSKKDGRIYRIRPASGAPVLQKFDLSKVSADELIGYLSHQNEWFRKQAQLEIGWRKLTELTPKLKALALDQKNDRALDAMFALHQLNALDDETNAQLLSHADPYVRRWAVRHTVTEMKATMAMLPKRAAVETHPEVQTMLAAAAKRLPSTTGLAILAALVDHDDSRLQTMLWWLTEARCENDREAVLAVFSNKAAWKHKLPGYLGKRWAMAGGSLNLESCAKLAALAPDDEARKKVVEGIAAAFEGGEIPQLPDSLAGYFKAQGDDLTLAMRSGDKKAIEEGLKLVANKSRPSAKRAATAVTLAELGNKKVLDAIAPVFQAGGNESLKRALLPAVAKFDDHKLINLMIDGWESRMAGDKALREAALRMFASRKEWAGMVLAKVDAWQIPAKHFTPDIVRQLAALNDENINATIEKHWTGMLAVAPTAEVEKEAERIKSVLKSGVGDPMMGKLQFNIRCAICHKLFGEGNDVGPELTGYDRSSMDFWLHNILTPSLEIREGFGNYVIKLKSGQVLSGIIAKQDATGVQIRDAANQLSQVKQAEIDKMEASPVSLMPPMLTAGMSDADLRDLFAWLMKEE